METTLAAFFYKIPKMRLVRSLFRLELVHVSRFPVVTGFAGCGTVLPSCLTTLTYRIYMIQGSRSISYIAAAVLASIFIS
jgi:hypothetical protein